MYEYKRDRRRIQDAALGGNIAGAERKRTKNPIILQTGRDTRECVLLLAAEVTGNSHRGTAVPGRDEGTSAGRLGIVHDTPRAAKQRKFGGNALRPADSRGPGASD